VSSRWRGHVARQLGSGDLTRGVHSSACAAHLDTDALRIGAMPPASGARASAALRRCPPWLSARSVVDRGQKGGSEFLSELQPSVCMVTAATRDGLVASGRARRLKTRDHFSPRDDPGGYRQMVAVGGWQGANVGDGC
jgi:hypothetical protein